jgi:hypothetical protein
MKKEKAPLIEKKLLTRALLVVNNVKRHLFERYGFPLR